MFLVFGTALLTGIGGPFMEAVLSDKYSSCFLFAKSESLPFVNKAFGLVVGLMFVYSFWFTMLGFSVGAARTKFKELAKKDNEKEIEERFSLPNLYVEGNTKWAKAFNCVQRSHQQQLETLTQFFACILVSALVFPLTATLLLFISLVSRYVWAKSYSASDGDPSKRYDHPLSKVKP